MFTTEMTRPFSVRITVDRALMFGPFDSSWMFGLLAAACGMLAVACGMLEG